MQSIGQRVAQSDSITLACLWSPCNAPFFRFIVVLCFLLLLSLLSLVIGVTVSVVVVVMFINCKCVKCLSTTIQQQQQKQKQSDSLMSFEQKVILCLTCVRSDEAEKCLRLSNNTYKSLCAPSQSGPGGINSSSSLSEQRLAHLLKITTSPGYVRTLNALVCYICIILLLLFLLL